MKLIIGLGNPGVDYLYTRHNTGFIFVDELQKVSLPKDVVVRKSDTFMNESGTFVKKLVDQYKLGLSDLYIVHDDLDIPLGSFKIQFGHGPKDHNGILDVEDKLGTKEFYRVRIGIDNRPLDGKPMGEVYTLENFTPEEKKILDGVISEACHRLINNLQLTINNEVAK